MASTPTACEPEPARLRATYSRPTHAREAPTTLKIPPLTAPREPSSSRSASLQTPPQQQQQQQTQDTRVRFLDRGGSALPDTSDRPSDLIELAEYPAAAREFHDAAVERQRRYDVKRADKRRWLEQQDEMKFSHSIQFNAVPDWSNHYIAYSNLKKL